MSNEGGGRNAAIRTVRLSLVRLKTTESDFFVRTTEDTRHCDDRARKVAEANGIMEFENEECRMYRTNNT
jgi:hypothetical protein